jgi:hypothetical protein
MKLNTLISAGFATLAVAVSIPAAATTFYPDIDFEWYANVGKYTPGVTMQALPAAREGYIYSPGRWEARGTRQVWVAGHYIKDDYAQQVAVYGNGNVVSYATGPFTLYDSQGNVIPTNPEAYPVDSARR